MKLLNTSVDQINNGSVLVNKLNSNYFLENFEFENKDELKNHFEKLYGDNNEFVKNELPDNLRKILKNYQVVGYLWLKKLIYLQAGGILADEMGLGKTIQTLSLLADIYFNKKTNLPSLVVCPSSLVYNWQKEFHQYAPYLKIAIIDGNQSERLSVLNRINEYDVVVTSYHLLNKDLELYKNIEFYIQILDEAQKIKNHYTQFSKDSKSINSQHKIALTGTPIENNLLELWSIFDYLMHNFLYDYRTFKINFQEKIINKDEESNMEKVWPPWRLWSPPSWLVPSEFRITLWVQAAPGSLLITGMQGSVAVLCHQGWAKETQTHMSQELQSRKEDFQNVL